MALDLTADIVKVAITAFGVKPTPADFVTAAWTRTPPLAGTKPDIDLLSTEYRYVKVTGQVSDGSTDTAWVQFLMGPLGAVAADAAGNADVWAQVADSPETIVRKVGTIKVS